MSSMPAKINPKEAEKKAYEELSVAEEFLKKDKEKITVWGWMMIVPLCMFVLFALLEEYAGATIFESSNNTLILSAATIIFAFGFLMSTVTAAQKGRIRVFRRRTSSWKMRETEWVEKSKNPRKFSFVINTRLGVAFAVCIGAVYAFLTDVF